MKTLITVFAAVFVFAFQAQAQIASSEQVRLLGTCNTTHAGDAKAVQACTESYMELFKLQAEMALENGEQKISSQQAQAEIAIDQQQALTQAQADLAEAQAELARQTAKIEEDRRNADLEFRRQQAEIEAEREKAKLAERKQTEREFKTVFRVGRDIIKVLGN